MEPGVLDGGEAILQALRDLGIEYIFSSPGSDWGSLWEALARQKIGGASGPQYLSCGHETLAVDLALGYTLMTGRTQAVVLHAGVGMLQGAVGVHGARLNEIPMMLLSGESTTFGDQEEFDPGAQWYSNHNNMGGLPRLVDPLVKWAHQAASPANLYELVVRAGELAQMPPVGPTYLDVPIEAMVAKWAQPAKLRRVPRPPKLRPSAADIERAAGMLLGARNPVITATSAGRTQEGYQALVALAELLAIPVVEGASADSTNFPKEHPLHQGFESKALLREADLAIAVRARTPWYPANMGPLNAKVIVIDDSPLKLHMAYQNLQADLFLAGDVDSTLALLIEALKASIGRADAAAVAERRARWSGTHARMEQKLREAEAEALAKPGIQAVEIAAALGQALPGNTVYVDETTTHGGINRRHLGNRGPQSYVAARCGLGQGLGITLGVKLARRDRPVALLIGDGAFLYNPTVQALGFARDQELPFLAVIYNNHGYRAMRRNQLSYYPQGAGVKNRLFYGEPLNEFAYEELPKLFGGFGARVEDPEQLKPVLTEAAVALSRGKCAVVNVLLED